MIEEKQAEEKDLIEIRIVEEIAFSIVATTRHNIQ